MKNTLPDIAFCSCGRALALHYPSPQIYQYMVRQVRRFGLMVTVATTRGSWRVPRHFLVLHGVQTWRIAELAAHFGWRQATR